MVQDQLLWILFSQRKGSLCQDRMKYTHCFPVICQWTDVFSRLPIYTQFTHI